MKNILRIVAQTKIVLTQYPNSYSIIRRHLAFLQRFYFAVLYWSKISRLQNQALAN